MEGNDNKPFVTVSVHTGSKWICCGHCEEPIVKLGNEIPQKCPYCGANMRDKHPWKDDKQDDQI